MYSDGYTLRLWPVVDGAGGRNGTYSISYGGCEFIENVLPDLVITDESRVEERCSNGQAPDVGDWDKETNVIVGGETALYNFYNITNSMGMGDTTMYAYLRYNYTQDNVTAQKAEGMKYVKFEVYFGIYDMRNVGAVAPETLDVALTDNDSTKASYATNRWIEVYIHIDNFNTIVGNGGYTFKLYPVTDGSENHSGTYSIAIKSVSFVEKKPIVELNTIELTEESRVEERCTNGQAPDVGNWDKETDVVVGGETALYNFYNVTNSMGMGDTTMYAYLKYNYAQGDVTAQKLEGKNFVKFEVYFGIYDMRNSGAVAPETLDVALTDNDSTKASYATNTWLEVYIPIDDFNTIVGNGGYTFKLYPVTDGPENHSGTYSIAIKSVSFVDEKPVLELPELELDFNASRVEERCTNGQAPDVGDWDKETDVVVGGETALYNFYNVTNSMGMGDTTMYAYLKYNYAQGDVTAQKLEGKNFVKFEVYFGIYDMRNSGAVAPETLDVALTDNDSTKASYATNTWLEVYIPIDDFNTIVGNGGYTFKLYPVTDGSENHSGTYSIAIKSVSFVESAQ